MDRKELYLNKINHAIVSKYDIEIIMFIDGVDCRLFKDLETGRCYEETGTKNPKGQFDNVKRRIKNNVFENIYKTCQVIRLEE